MLFELYLISIVISNVLFLITCSIQGIELQYGDDVANNKFWKIISYLTLFIFYVIVCFFPIFNLVINSYFIYSVIRCKIKNNKFYKKIKVIK